MKKRILALVLLLCMAVSILAGCTYSYADDDMSQYVSTTKEDFLAALKGLKIVDGDFSANEATRQAKVADAVLSALANIGENKTEGSAGAGDKVFYRYFAVLSSDLADTQIDLLDYDSLAPRMLFASNMTGALQSSILGLNDATDFDAALLTALAGYTFSETNNYATEASDVTVAADDVIFVTFKRTYQDQNDKTVTETFTSMRLWNCKNTIADPYTPAPSDILFDNFIGKKTTDTIAEFKYTAEGTEYTVKDAKINSIVKAPVAAADDANYGTAVVVKCTPYEDDEATVVNVLGEKIKVGDKELTYFVYPVNYNKAKAYTDLTATEILKDLFAAGINTDAFSADELAKTTDGVTLETLINGDTAEGAAAEMKDSLAAIFDYITTPKNHADVTAGTKTEAEIKTTYEGYRDSRIAKIVAIEGVDVAAAYKKSVYNELDAKYVADIRDKVSHEFHHIVSAIEIKKNSDGSLMLPEDAVDEIYDILYENEKYNFNYGYDTNSASLNYNLANYKIYGGSFDNYLIKTFTTNGTGTVKDAKAAIRASAEEFVATAVRVYFAANCVGALISEDEFEKRYETWYDNFLYQSQIYAYLGMSYPDPGEQGMRLAFQAQDLYDTLLYVTGEKEAIDAYIAAAESDPENAVYDFDNVVYKTVTEGENTMKYLDFVNVSYSFKAE